MSRFAALNTIGSTPLHYAVPAAYSASVTPNTSSIYEGEGNVTFNITTSNITNGTTLYYTLNTISGSIAGASFTDATTSGTVTVSSNAATLTKYASAEDGNSTDDIFTLSLRVGSYTGTILNTSSNVKLVDLTAYNTASNNYSNLTVAYSVGSAGGQGTQYNRTGTTGGTTTVTYAGYTITAYGGAGGMGYPNGSANILLQGGTGGSFAGSYDGGVYGGNGGNVLTQWSSGGTGGGGLFTTFGTPATVSSGGYINGIAYGYGSTGGALPNNDSTGLYTFLASQGKSIGGGANGHPASSGAYASGGGGSDYAGANQYGTVIDNQYGGHGGPFGGGGGGGFGYTTYAGLSQVENDAASGPGGTGGVAISYASSTGSGGTVITTYGSGTYSLPSNTTSVKIWVAGGGGGAGYGSRGFSLGGGGGGMCYRTWTRTAATKPSL